MPKYSRLTHIALGSAPLCAFFILTSAIGCAGDDPGLPIDEGNTAGSTSTGGTGSAGAPGTAGTTTGTAGTTGNGGSSGVAGGSAGSGGIVGSSGSANAGAGGSATGGTTGNGGGSGGTGASVGCSAKVCQDFEKDLDATWALKVSGEFTAKIDTAQFHGGSRSLHVVAPNKTNSAWLTILSDKFPAADFWGRAWYRITGPKGGHQEYIIAPASGNELRILNRKTDSENMGVNTQTPDKWYLTNTPVPQSMWFCYEFHVTATATTVYPNGKEATEAKPPGVTGVKSLSFGWQRWQTGGGDGEMWIDDIAIGDKQIGCE